MVNSELRIQISSENRIRRRYSNLEFRIHYSPFTILLFPPHCPVGVAAVPGIFMARVTCPVLASEISILNFSSIVPVACAYWVSALA